MLTAFILNEKLGEGKDGTVALTWLSERRKKRPFVSSNRTLVSRVPSMTSIYYILNSLII